MISINIIVKNDRRIERLLNKLNEIPKPEKTEIIVIDASKKETLLDIKKKFPKVRWIYFNNTNKKYTFAQQRNTGLRSSKGDIIVFIDSDCIPTKYWLIKLVNPILKENEDVVAGFVKSIGGGSINDITWIKRRNKNYLSECTTINLAFKKELLEKIGYFDEYFDGGGEDTDFSWRIISNNYKIRYNKNAIIYHDWGNIKKEMRRAIRRGETAVRLYRRYPERWKNLFSNYIDVLIYPIYIIFLPVAFFWPPYLLFLLIPLTRNLLTKSLRKYSIQKIFLDLVRGLGVLKELFFPSKLNNAPKHK